jgi:hypothetical protein
MMSSHEESLISPDWIEMGPLAEFVARIESRQADLEDRELRFGPTSGHFWLFEDEDEEEIQGAILSVQNDSVYAISPAVVTLVENSLAA